MGNENNVWYSTKEPPPKDLEVLICTSKDSIYGQYISVSAYKGETDYGDSSHGTAWDGMDFHEEVIYWQYLPPLPKD